MYWPSPRGYPSMRRCASARCTGPTRRSRSTRRSPSSRARLRAWSCRPPASYHFDRHHHSMIVSFPAQAVVPAPSIAQRLTHQLYRVAFCELHHHRSLLLSLPLNKAEAFFATSSSSVSRPTIRSSSATLACCASLCSLDRNSSGFAPKTRLSSAKPRWDSVRAPYTAVPDSWRR